MRRWRAEGSAQSACDQIQAEPSLFLAFEEIAVDVGKRPLALATEEGILGRRYGMECDGGGTLAVRVV